MAKPNGSKRKKVLIAALGLLTLGFVVPERRIIPVSGATQKDWNPQSFWFEPWGKSGVHKGIDIFANANTPVLSSTDGIVIFRGELELGGKVLAVLGPKWRVHYFAHLNSLDVRLFAPVYSGQVIGKVGNTGNAMGKPPHYAIVRLLPAPWAIDRSTLGYKKALFIDPDRYIQP